MKTYVDWTEGAEQVRKEQGAKKCLHLTLHAGRCMRNKNNNKRRSSKITLNEQVVCARQCCKWYKWIVPFHFPNKSMRKLLVLFLFCRWGNESKDDLKDYPKSYIVHMESRGEIWTHICLISEPRILTAGFVPRASEAWNHLQFAYGL